MKDITKLIRRFVGILLLSTVLVIVLNIIVLAAISASQTANGDRGRLQKKLLKLYRKQKRIYLIRRYDGAVKRGECVGNLYR